jgi:hypothetical protein
MNRYIRLGLPLVFVSFMVLTGCSKLFPPHPKVDLSGSGGSPKCPANLKITANDSTPVVDSNVILTTNQTGLMDQWSGPGNYFLSANTGQDGITINQIMIYQSGWYYCVGEQTNCNSVADSIFIDVQYQQGTPSCSLTNDQISNTAGLPDFNGGTLIKSYGGYGAIQLDVEDGVVEYDFVFNPNNGNTEPKDGIYYTTNDLSFSNGQDADAIILTINYFPYYLTSDPGYKVYVSHVSGKLRISFCSLKAEGSGASGLFTGQVTEQ